VPSDYVILVILNGVKMKDNQEFYEFIDDLEQELKKLGDGVAAEKLRLAKEGGSVGTEVFMALSNELNSILITNLDLPLEIRGKISEAINDLNIALDR
jgi:hypothetical protein